MYKHQEGIYFNKSIVPTTNLIANSTNSLNGTTIDQIIKSFASLNKSSGDSPTHNVKHSIITTSRPVRSKFRRLNAEKLAVAKEEFRKLQDPGISNRY